MPLWALSLVFEPVLLCLVEIHVLLGVAIHKSGTYAQAHRSGFAWVVIRNKMTICFFSGIRYSEAVFNNQFFPVITSPRGDRCEAFESILTHVNWFPMI